MSGRWSERVPRFADRAWLAQIVCAHAGVLEHSLAPGSRPEGNLSAPRYLNSNDQSPAELRVVVKTPCPAFHRALLHDYAAQDT
jgi:hypothetical protein